MDLRVIWAALVRRWYFVLFVVACAVGATLYVANWVGPTYEAQGAVLIFPPVATVQRGSETVTQGNPYLALDGVSQARDIVIRELTSKATADEFDLRYPGTTYVATPDVMNNAPIILITVESPAVDTAVEAVSSVMGIVPTTLAGLQEGLGLDSNSVITSKPLIADQRPESVHKEQIRAAVVAAAATLGLGLLAIGLIDGLLTGRRKKRHQAKLVDPPTPGGRSAPLPGLNAGRSGGDHGKTVESHHAENGQVTKSVGLSSSRLRPRSTGPNVAAVPTKGSAKRGAVPLLNSRDTRSHPHNMADPAQRR